MNILASLSAFSSGIVTGGAFAAVMALVKFIPRLVSLTETHKYLKIYENLFILGTILFTIGYFLNFFIAINNIIFIMFLGLIFGTFLGIFNAALAETLNVIPILAKKFKMKKNIKPIFYSLVAGKVIGSVLYFLYF